MTSTYLLRVASLAMLSLGVAIPLNLIAATQVEANKVTRKMRIFCKSDYRRFCPRYKIQSARARQCMRANARNLSPICQQALIEAGYSLSRR